MAPDPTNRSFRKLIRSSLKFTPHLMGGGDEEGSVLNRISNYFSGVWAEFQRVTWPTRRQAVEMTAVVVGISLAVAGFVGGLDYAFSNFVQSIVLKK